jgi:phosphoesterase RecJ-like protein
LTQIDDNKIKASLRTAHNDIDVAKLAQQYGGGGHKKAAGFTVRGILIFQDNKWQIK